MVFYLPFCVCLYYRADAIYQSMKSTYGSHACHLLRINSRSMQAAETTAPSDSANHMPDPWSQYLNKTYDAGVSWSTIDDRK